MILAKTAELQKYWICGGIVNYSYVNYWLHNSTKLKVSFPQPIQKDSKTPRATGVNDYKLGLIVDAVPYTLKGAITEVLSWPILKATSVAVQIENRGERFCPHIIEYLTLKKYVVFRLRGWAMTL
jgi:hypothetical protein